MADDRNDPAPVGGWRPVGYARISLDKEGAGLGVERQTADINDLAERLGLPAPVVIPDNDVSAYSGRRRPGYERLVAGIRAGHWNVLLIWHVDRLTRSMKELEEIVDLANATGLRIETVRGGRVDLSTGEGRLQARILGTLARYESEHRSDRVRRRMLQNAEAGRPHGSGGARPFGYEPDKVTVRPVEAAFVVDILDRLITGESLRSLVRYLIDSGVATSTGVPWRTTTLRTLLLGGRIAGLRVHRGEILGPAVWPALVDRDKWEMGRAILTDPARKTSPGNKPTRLMSGLASCGVKGCGAPVRSGGVRDGVLMYRCTEVDHLRRRMTLVDDVVTRYVVGWLVRDGVTFDAPPTTVTPSGDVRGKADAVRFRIGQVEDALIGDPTEDLVNVSRDGLSRNLARLRAQLEDLERQEALFTVPAELTGVTAENFPGLPFERRRNVIRYLCQTTILPTTKGGHAGEESIDIRPNPKNFPEAA
ncbi:hypothetical protein CcI49_38010 [Frankia sp. CcI49]|uniref:recombinase family protein n=1 Tax=Frankia sp. CcI49 TaxID=1745382 RepID=UPI00097588B9|nr:recombinase family protein [Frankia sp. CcI49]ONH49984.1 hypothetical protein CcI49_38010 [Frankia sp. CcI49]